MDNKKKAPKKTQTKAVVLDTPTASVHPRTNFDGYVAPLMQLYREHTQELYIAGFDPTAVLDELAAYTKATATVKALRAQLAAAMKVQALHGGNVWKAELEVYQRGRSAGRTNDDIQHGIAAFEQFMKVTPHRKPAPAPVTTP